MRSSTNFGRPARRAVLFSLLLSINAIFLVPGIATAHAPECGRVIGSGLATGYGPNGFGYLADNAVAYGSSNSHFASNDYAIFQTHDPWGDTVVKTAITDAGHTYDVFTPADLGGFPFSGYRVIVLNWDDSFVGDFSADYAPALSSLQSYVRNGGVLWVQAAIQDSGVNSFAMPFGGTENWGLSSSDVIVDPSSSLVTGAPSPLTGNSASHASYSSLPAGAHVIARQTDVDGPPNLYTLTACPTGSYKPDGSIRKGGAAYVGNNIYNTDATGQSRTGSAARGQTITFGIAVQNDGKFSDRFTIAATGAGTTKYTVTYFRGTTNITAAVVAGTYRTAMLAPRATTLISAKVKVKSTATAGSSVTRLVTISSGVEPVKRDAVKFVGKLQ